MTSAIRTRQMDEEALIRAASQGDLEAFNQLVLAYQDLVYRLAYNLLGDHQSAEDLAQDAFIQAFRKIDSFRGGSFRAWLARVTTNACYDELRRRKRHPTQPLYPENDDGEEIETPAWLEDPGASVEEAVEREELREIVQKILAELPPKHRTIITLIDLSGMGYEETAQALQISIGTVKSRLARARLRVKHKLAGVPEYTISQQPVKTGYPNPSQALEWESSLLR